MSQHSLANEWFLVRRSRLLLGVFAILAIIMTFAAVNGTNRLTAHQSTITDANGREATTLSAIAASLEKFEQSPGSDVPAVADPGAVGLSIAAHYAALDFSPLAPFAVGQSDIYPSYYRVTATSLLTTLGEFDIQNPVLMQIGAFDIAFVVIYLVPIFVLVLSYNILSGEKERDTLRLALAQPITVTSWLRAKIIWRVLFIFSALAIMGFAALLIVNADFNATLTWVQFSAWLVVIALYAAFWFLLALLVNSYNKSSATNGIILAAAWLILVVLLPAMVSLTANSLYPAPSRVMLAAELREASAEADAKAAEALEDFYFDHPEFAAPGEASQQDNNFFLQTLSKDASIEKAIAPLLQDFEDQAEAQQNSVRQLQYLSPAIMTQQALNTISGTDYLQFQDFQNQVSLFHDAWSDFFISRIMEEKTLTSADIRSLPQFQYQEMAAGPVIRTVLTSALGLIVINILLAFLAGRQLRRYKVVG